MFLQVPMAESVLVPGTPAVLASGEGRLSLKTPLQKRNKVWEVSEIWRLWFPAGFVMTTLARAVSGNSAAEALCPRPSQAQCISHASAGEPSRPVLGCTCPRSWDCGEAGGQALPQGKGKPDTPLVTTPLHACSAPAFWG